jgi:predicted nucleotidyltransferase component of viral defense system
MIRKQDILERAAEWQLRPDVVEKDYVLGWLLAALSSYDPARALWIFKGGTCIKKCYFETYRFSEDLDFTLLPDAPYTPEAIADVLRSLTLVAQELSGVDFPLDLIAVKQRRNKQGHPTFQGRVSYRGPLGFGAATPPRILFDITQHERLLDEPTVRPVFHPYPDELPNDAGVFTYSFNELLAEKTRALFERSRPRDLYDVIYLLENQPEAFELPRVRDLFKGKCEAKNLQPPSSDELIKIVTENEELRSEWANMLGHQLPVLPNLDSLLDRLPALLSWIDEPYAPIPTMELPLIPMAATETPIARAGIQYWGGGLPLESIRFAGANRLLVEFDYHGKHRLAEPYSLRQAQTGNLLFYGWEQGATHIKAFILPEMQAVRVTDLSFQPRYRVELTPHGPLTVPPTSSATLTRLTSPRVSSRSQTRHGPVYVFQCPYCQKRFPHSKNDPALNKHKNKQGWNCPGRRGYLVETKYR